MGFFDSVFGKKKVDLYTEAKTALERGDVQRGLGIYRQLADNGDAEAQCRLAFVCKSGLHDFEQAAFWYRKAADQGHAEAQCKIGFLYRSGRGVPKNDTEGARWYEKSAIQGYAEAQYNLARCYLEGRGVSRDPATAVKWFTSAAEAGHRNAEYTLGVLFLDGSDVPRDAQKAIYWLNRAADRATVHKQTIGDVVAPAGDERDGGINALFNLGQIYRQGAVVPTDPAKAFRYFLRAAQLGDGGSQYAVGVSYFYGDGISRDERMGIEYLRKAALQGSQEAQQALVKLKHR